MAASRASSLSDKEHHHEPKTTVTPPTQVHLGRLEEGEEEGEVDGVFGLQKVEGRVDFRAVGWVSTSVLMTKATVGLGVLSLPSSFETLGLVPGILILLFIATITCYTQYIITGPWKQNHPTCYSTLEAGRILWGPVGGEIAGVGYWLFMLFVAGAGIVGLSTALNAISLHATCTAWFVLVAAVVTFPFASLRTLGSIKFVGWIGLASVVVSILLVTIAVGAGGRPSPAPQTGPWEKGIVYFGSPTFADAMSAISNIMLSFAGACIFLPIVSEMRDIRQAPKAVFASQAFVTAFYLSISVVVYMYAGQYVASPALGTAGVLIKRVAYGLAIPALLAAATMFTHLSAKWIFVRALRNSRHLTQSTKTHWTVWLSCVFGCLALAYIVASGIPVFGGLVSLIGALFGSFLSVSLPAYMWLFDNRQRSEKGAKYWAMWVINVLIFLVGLFITVGGTYGSVVAIRAEVKANGGSAWSCADNSGSS
ncbi:hypothetical protein JCM8097_005407 [Rhodosporidiobolus ruineniae]